MPFFAVSCHILRVSAIYPSNLIYVHSFIYLCKVLFKSFRRYKDEQHMELSLKELIKLPF